VTLRDRGEREGGLREADRQTEEPVSQGTEHSTRDRRERGRRESGVEMRGKEGIGRRE
jgi:hypothetical protein